MAEPNRALGYVKEFGSLINTCLLVAGALGLIWKGGGYMEATDRGIEGNAQAITALSVSVTKALADLLADENKWRESHLQMHTDRNGEVREREGAINARLVAIEQNAEADGRKVDNAIYRVQVLEQGRVGDSAAIREVQKSVTDLAGDMKVVRELLQRQSNNATRETR
ncbi:MULTISPECIES: hypothetical protein [unclassified Rhizobium]|uniref:hypothetical protein n=1 Tax=unclassified Rhizobium TaxID=2613769 RepID=UPI0012E3A586|nr:MULTISPECIES: hypothetical protein [unclassified Rhizobium]